MSDWPPKITLPEEIGEMLKNMKVGDVEPVYFKDTCEWHLYEKTEKDGVVGYVVNRNFTKPISDNMKFRTLEYKKIEKIENEKL